MDQASGSRSKHPSVSGWLYKWTNYLSGYKKRWFVLSEGILSYYRSREEMSRTCRGTLCMAGAKIESDDTCHFIISNGDTYHVKAENEMDRERWVTALRWSRDLAREEQPEDKASSAPSMPALMARMKSKLKVVQTCSALMNKHGQALQQSLSEIETLSANPETNFKALNISESAAILRAITTSMINACSEYLDLAECHHEKCGSQMKRVGLGRLVDSMTILQRTSNRSTSNPTIVDNEGIFYECEDSEPERFTPRSFPALQVFSALRGTSSTDLPGTSIAKEKQQLLKSSRATSKRRTRVPDRPPVSANLWALIKNCIGKDLTKMPIPVSFLEPLSLLQRLTEDFEYASLLDKAADITDPGLQLAYVTAFAISSYSTTVSRTGKPFNPLHGETYECDRMEDLGWRSIAEQVSHHPPIAALHCEGKHWQCWMEESMTTKFRGQTLSVLPQGEAHIKFKTGTHYTWHKVTTNIHNLMIGKIFIDQEGDLIMDCCNNKYKAKVTFYSVGFFSGDLLHKVSGNVMDGKGEPKYAINGRYSEKLELTSMGKESNPIVLWQRTMPPEESSKYYNLTVLACQLNEMEDGVAPTDSRLRPDQRLMEEGKFEEANKMKSILEEFQRTKQNTPDRPAWFVKQEDPDTKTTMHVYGGEYWKCKEKKDWGRCPRGIYQPSLPDSVNT